MRVFKVLHISIFLSGLKYSQSTSSLESIAADLRGGGSPSSFPSDRSSPQYYDSRDEEYDNEGALSGKDFKGLGREFDLFSGNVLNKSSRNADSPRGGSTEFNENISSDDYSTGYSGSTSTYTPGRAGGRSRKRSRRSSNSSSRRYSSSSTQTQQKSFQNPFVGLRTWLTENQASIPRIQVKVEPNTTLKLRKRFRPLFKTVVTLGADFNSQLGVWQFKSSWEDSIIGGRLMLAGRELQLSKTWLLSVGAVEDLVTRLRFRAAIDLGTGKAYARFGFRSERLSPINVVEGFTLLRQLPLDGPDGHVKLEVKANFAFPEPEIEYSTEKGGRSLIGMGDIEVNLDELNLLLDY